MVFTKRLREGVRRGEITCSVRFWMHPHVRVGARDGISGRAGSAEGGEARPEREDLFGAVSLCAAAGQGSREAEDLVNYNELRDDGKGSGNVNNRTLENHKGRGTRLRSL